MKKTDSQILAVYRDLGIDTSRFPARENPADTATKINPMRYDAVKMTISFSGNEEIKTRERR